MLDFMKKIKFNWERWIFGCVGLSCLVFTFSFLLQGQVTSASAVFAMAFFSFFYSNLARFKRFKGLGFEAELWEDKQREAAALIERLKSVVSIYTREIVMGSVMRGRWGGDEKWAKRWALLDDLRGSHTELGQDIDFSDLQHDVESVFIFDMVSPLSSIIRQVIDRGKETARTAGSERFGNPITDTQGFNAFHQKLNSIVSVDDDLFNRAKRENIARSTLNLASTSAAMLRDSFGIAIAFPDGLLERLSTIAVATDNRPIVPNPQLIEWADDHNAFSEWRRG